jgi:hypothetical protein
MRPLLAGCACLSVRVGGCVLHKLGWDKCAYFALHSSAQHPFFGCFPVHTVPLCLLASQLPLLFLSCFALCPCCQLRVAVCAHGDMRTCSPCLALTLLAVCRRLEKIWAFIRRLIHSWVLKSSWAACSSALASMSECRMAYVSCGEANFFCCGWDVVLFCKSTQLCSCFGARAEPAQSSGLYSISLRAVWSRCGLAGWFWSRVGVEAAFPGGSGMLRFLG